MRLLGHLTAAASFVALSACAPTTIGGTPEPETIRVAGAGEARSISSADVNVVEIPYPIDQVWRILPAAYDSVGLAIAAADQNTHIVGNGGFKLRRQLGGTPLSKYLDCGGTQIGASADSYDIVLTVRTQLRADSPTGTSVLTVVEAVGKPVAFAQGYSSCTSTGKLEARLAEVIQAKLR